MHEDETEIEARYNKAKGVFEPLEAVDLPDRTRVWVSVEPEEPMSEEEWWEFINEVIQDVERQMQEENEEKETGFRPV